MSDSDTIEGDRVRVGEKSKNQLKRTHHDIAGAAVGSTQPNPLESSSSQPMRNTDSVRYESQAKPSKSLKNSGKTNLQLILSGNHTSHYPSTLKNEVSSAQTPGKGYSEFPNSSQRTLQITRPPKSQRLNSSPSTPLQATQNSSSIVTDELVPYHDWKVILRSQQANQIILYNRQSHKLAVTSSRNVIKTSNSEDPLCHFCHQRLPEGFPGYPSGSGIKSSDTVFVDGDTTEKEVNQSYSVFDDPEDNPRLDFIDRNYFRCLASSHSSLGNHRFLVDDVSKDTENFGSPIEPEADFLSQNSFNQGYYNKFFKEVKKLGKGAKGNVFLCQHVLEDIELGRYAVKKVAIGNNHTWLARMLKEVHMLERLRHPNIIDYKHAWLENHQPNLFAPVVPCLFILMECANFGNLEEFVNRRTSRGHFKPSEFELERMTPKDRAMFLRQQNARKREKASRNNSNPASKSNHLPLREILSLFLDICHGLAHLHRYDIVHRDIKPPNLLLSIKDLNDTKEIPTVLISDFGECEDANKLRNPTGRTGATGTLEFMAPELIQMSENGLYVGEHSKKADMWSLGMVLYYLCYSELPYAQIEDIDLLRDEILCFQGPIKFPDDSQGLLRIPTQFKRLISLLLSRDPQLRPSVDEILANARDVDFQLLVPGHYYPNSLDSLDNSNTRPSKESNAQRCDLVPFYHENSLKTLTCSGNGNSITPEVSSTPKKPDSPLIVKQPSHPTLKETHLHAVLIGLKMASILFPCYPTSAHLAASLPLTALAICGLYSRDSNTQWCLLALHASFLTFFVLSFGSVCSA